MSNLGDLITIDHDGIDTVALVTGVNDAGELRLRVFGARPDHDAVIEGYTVDQAGAHDAATTPAEPPVADAQPAGFEQ